jgi:hypothetical protein
MHELANIKSEHEKYRAQKEKCLISFSAVTLAVFLAVALGILYSPEDYLLLKWILIILLTFYIWGTIYFFSSPYRMVKKYERFFASAMDGLSSEETLTVKSLEEEEILTKDGLPAKIVRTSFQEGSRTYERDLYIIEGQPLFKPGETIKAMTFSSVLLAYEVLR